MVRLRGHGSNITTRWRTRHSHHPHQRSPNGQKMNDEPNPCTHHCPAVNEFLRLQEKNAAEILMREHLKSIEGMILEEFHAPELKVKPVDPPRMCKATWALDSLSNLGPVEEADTKDGLSMADHRAILRRLVSKSMGVPKRFTEEPEPTKFETLYMCEPYSEFQTTAIYPNRVEDKEKVERLTGLQEQGSDNTTFYIRGEELFAIGYNRVVYGDHGPYVEFSWINIESILIPKRAQPHSNDYYYEWLTPFRDPNVKVYKQLKTVANLPNPPRGGFRGNRKEGYADYKVGMIYVSVGDFTKIVNR